MCNADVIYVQTLFPKDRSFFYTPAAMIGLALVTFTTPMAAVMFPKIVQSAARTEKTDALRHALAATALLVAVTAIACTLLPQLPLRIIYFRSPVYWQSAPLVPWFAWSLLPLILANVLISNLLARARYQVVPWAVLVAAGYATALFLLREQVLHFGADDFLGGFKVVIGTLGGFSVLLLIVAVLCTFGNAPRPNRPSARLIVPGPKARRPWLLPGRGAAGVRGVSYRSSLPVGATVSASGKTANRKGGVAPRTGEYQGPRD